MLFFIFFAVSMVSAVVATYRHPPQLMQQDYYALDINYQDRLDKKQNAAAMVTQPQVLLNEAGKSIHVTFPEGMVAQEGTAKCYRSSTTNDDFSTAIGAVGAFDIPANGLTAGRWHVELDWHTADGKKYFWETTLTI